MARAILRRGFSPCPMISTITSSAGSVPCAAPVAASHTSALVMLDTLRHAALPITDEGHQRLLRQQGELLIEQVRTQLKGPDLQEVEARFVSFCAALGQMPRAQ